MVRTFLQLASLNDIYLKHFSKVVKCFYGNAMYTFLEKLFLQNGTLKITRLVRKTNSRALIIAISHNKSARLVKKDIYFQ